LNVLGVSGVRQTETHTTQSLVSEPCVCDVEMAVEKLKRYKSLDVDKIPVELMKAGDRIIRFEIHKLIQFGIKRNCQSSGRIQSISMSASITRGQHIVVIIGASLFSAIYKILHNPLLSNLIPHVDEIVFQFGT
jgi:hypothetical protein